ncbi:hypothetical protein A6R68_15405, partial [Neotoma lepida]
MIIFIPNTDYQKLSEVDEERKLHSSYEKCMATEVAADALGEDWKDDDVHQHVVINPLNKGKKYRTKSPRTQRLVTPRVLQRKHLHTALKKQHTKKTMEEAAKYVKP